MYNSTWRKSQRLGKGQKEEGRMKTTEEGREKLEIVNHKKDILVTYCQTYNLYFNLPLGHPILTPSWEESKA